MSFTQEQVAKVLSEIQSRVPKNLLTNVATEVKTSPTVEFVMKKVLKDKLVSEEKLKQIQTLMDNGTFSKTKVQENPRYAKMIDEFITREIKKAQKKGLLPKKKEMQDLAFVKEIYEKVLNQGNQGTDRS